MRAICKHRAASFKRVLFLIFMTVMLCGNFGVGSIIARAATDESVVTAAEEASTATQIDFSGYQSSPLDIYNSLYFADANGAVTLSGGSYKIIGTSGQPIVIGNHPIEGNSNTNPLDADIRVSLAELHATGTMTVKPTGTANGYKAVLTVSAESSLGALVLEDSARVDLILNANLAVGSITAGANSVLTVSGSGTLTVGGAFNGGTVNLNGGTVVANNGISAVNLSLNGTNINANSNTIASTETLSMHSSKVENASLFGYKGGAESGRRVLTLSGNNTFANVTAVGCAQDSAVIVSIKGIDTVLSSSSTTYYCDYQITYLSGSDTVAPQEEWPVAYRVGSGIADFKNVSILGYHTGSGYKSVTDGAFNLPTYAKPGYEGQGWKLSGSEDLVSRITAAGGDLTLSAVMQARAVTVSLDRGYDPDQYTNDKESGALPARTITVSSKIDATLSLPVPARFGYKFLGWKITSGNAPREIPYEEEYLVALGDLVEEGTFTVTMEAKWEADKFNITLFLGSSVADDSKLSISVDGGNTFKNFKDLASDQVTITGRTIGFSSEKPIAYGEKISAYLKTVFPELPKGTLPILRDDSAAGTAQTFVGWSNVSGEITGGTYFLYGENGMLIPGDKPLTEYQQDLHGSNAPVNASWGTMHYYLTLPDTMPSGWTLTYIDSVGEEKTIRGGTALAQPIDVQQDSAVTLATSATNPENFSLWGFLSGRNKLFPEEQEYRPGDSVLTYKFSMPAASVNATYHQGEEIWIDIARSPITFAEDVEHNNRQRDGFWYTDTIDEMTHLFQGETGYFYQWNFDDPFRVTSNGVATQNQLTLVNALTGGVYLKDVNLVMREAYVSGTEGSLLSGVDCESSVASHANHTAEKVEAALQGVNLSDYANIVINNSTWQAYTTTLHFIGENTVGAIMQDKFRVSINNENPLNLTGGGKDSCTVKLGTAFGNFEYKVSKIKVTEYTKTNDFKYLFYCAYQTGCVIENAVIEAPHKSIHAGWMTDTRKKVSFTNSTADLYTLCCFRTILANGSYLRIRESMRLGILPLYLANNSKVVVDGNIEMNYHHWSDSDVSENSGATDNTDNWLVVKGTFCDISNRTWRGGTLICNTLVLGRTGGIKGGTVIANQIINQAVGFWKYDANNHVYGYDPQGSNQTQRSAGNLDDYPFTVYHHKSEQPNAYTFSGGKIYLLGYYKTKKKTITESSRQITITAYDSTVTATTENNPVAQFMNPLFDANGDLVANPAVNTDAVETAVRNSALKSNECIVIGNSNNYYSTRRSVEISGGEIYAAGNITFYNNTTVSGGTVYCNGSFGSKGDLKVTGGSITATAVGNAYNLTTTLEDGTLRWKRTDIQGGTVAANRIGAFEKRVSDTAEPAEAQKPKGTVTIGGSATVAGEPKICHDVYINYIFDASLFNNNGTPTNANTLRFEAKWKQGTSFANQGWSNTALTFTAPQVAGGGNGFWNWDSLTGNQVDSISDKGFAQKDGAALAGSPKAYDRILIKLYAVKGSYDLIFKVGADKITTITSGGSTVEKTNTDGKITASVSAGGEVVLTFASAAMAKDYTVLWYIDGSKIIHSVNPIVNGNTISFTMPNSDVEVYAAEEIYLDLDIASYTLLQDGFRTEGNATPERTDSTFRYLGSLVIHQGRITQDITFNIDDFGNEQMVAPRNGSAIIQTLNRILVDKDFNNSTNNRKVTLRRIYQNGTSTSYGIEMQVGANATFLLDGAIRICRVYVPFGSDFTLDGKNNRDADAIYPIYNGDALKGDDFSSIGNYTGKAGNITLQDLTILGKQQGLYGALGYSKVGSENTVQYVNCRCKSSQLGTDSYGWYNRSYFAYRAGKVIFDNCEITLKISRDWPGSFCDESKEVTIRNGSKITVTENGACQTDPARPFYLRIQEKLLIDNATLDLSLRVPDDGKTYRVYQGAGSLPQEVKLTNNANLILEQRARLKKLVIGDMNDSNSEDSSTVKVGQTGTGYLLCENIEVNDNAKLEAGGIIVSGFYNGANEFGIQTKGDFLKAMAEGKYIFDGKDSTGLVVNGGTVISKEYITGDVNGKITVNGGTVTAPKIGTTGYLYGYTQYVPRAGEEYIYTYERIPVGMTVDITGGEVNVSRYLGGMKATVTVSGGIVNLAEDAVLGLTEEQQTTLYNYATENGQTPSNFGSLTVSGGKVEGAVDAANTKGGSIQVPYGTVNIGGAGIYVYDLTANGGRVTISGAGGNFYTNPYSGSDKPHENLAVYVVNRLSAQYLTITAGSLVYANYAYANVPKDAQGGITVTVDDQRAYLYVGNAYGAIGEGNGTPVYDDDPKSESRNVFGSKVVDVHYIMHPLDVFLPEDIGREENPNMERGTGLPYYVVSTVAGTTYTLKPAVCSGYIFLGWFVYDPDNGELGEPVSAIDLTNSQAVYLGAKWEKVQVKFEIQIKLTDASEYNSATMEPVAGTAGLYRFKELATVTYGDVILTAQGLNLANYLTNTLGVIEVSYGGKIIQSTDRVTVEMTQDFVNSSHSPVVLMVTDKGTQTNRILITLEINKNEKGRPIETLFRLSPGTVNEGSDTGDHVGVFENVTGTLGDIKPFAYADEDGLINPTAPGYTFGGWYTDKSCTDGSKVNSNTTLKSLYDAHTTTLYAKWTPNTYMVQFSALSIEGKESFGNRCWVTKEDVTPTYDQTTNSFLNYYWIYDTPSNVDGNFWVEENGTKTYMTALPLAWGEGYFFTGWQAKEHDGVITGEDELNKFVMKTLQENNFVGASQSEPALILYASYRKVEVTYKLNGGKWTVTPEPSSNPAYGVPLAGYSKSALGTESTGYDKFGEALGEDGTKYFVVSTTSSYFKTSGYVQEDYRHTLSRKGYTFHGWIKADGNHCGCTPRFHDITVTAEWVANTYSLELHVKDDSYDGSYESAFSPNSSNVTVTIGSITVGEAIPKEATGWPDKTAWYAYSSSGTNDENKRRYMLGVTFAGLDPGDSSVTASGRYAAYANAVTNMLNGNTMFDRGDVFFLPEDDVYEEDLRGATATTETTDVPDYPTGSTVPMYSVYRERSLVFIEKYVDSNGDIQEYIMYSCPWNSYTDYPFETYPNDTQNGHYGQLTGVGGGYALVGWYVGSDTIDDSRKYPESATDFNDKIDGWKNNASITVFDINVYTAYVAQQTISQTMTASQISTTDAPKDSVFHTLPGSMQEGKLRYAISDLSGLNLVSKQDMLNHQYDSEWGTNYTANNTVAIELKLEKDAASFTTDLIAAGEQPNSWNSIGKGWKITLTLYHSKVMTVTKDYTFTITYSFEKMAGNVNQLNNQWLKEEITVTLQPSQYDVEYRVDLPEAKNKLTPLAENGFEEIAGDDYHYNFTVKQNYNSALLALDQTMQLEGYMREAQWHYGTGADAITLANLALSDGATKKAELSDGRITVSVGYVAKTYSLTKEGELLSGWTVTYGNGAGDSGTSTLGTAIADVKYHSLVTFTLQTVEYITLVFGDGTTMRLDKYAQKQEDGKYTFVMPAKNITLKYVDVTVLYLDDGTIELSSEGYTQGAGLVSWPGDYQILQCAGDNTDFHTTANVLKLKGDLLHRNDGTNKLRKISLGNLNITSDNSIELNGCTVSLMQEGRIQAKNILVPNGTSLTVTGAYNKADSDQSADMILEPSSDRAAIGATGANAANGSITLNKVDVSMKLNAPSVSSGIGSGNQDNASSYGKVEITDSRITVVENSSVSAQYKGAWVGGACVSNVSMSGTSLVDGNGSNHYAKAVDGLVVNLDNCQIGESGNPVKEPIHAANKLNITDSTIYLQNDYDLNAVSMIGTNGSGTTTVSGSTVQVGYGGNGDCDKLFTGRLSIQDAASDVTIGGTQVVEVGNGAIVIEEAGVTQAGVEHLHSGLNYLLLDEDGGDTAPNLTVKGLGENKTIAVDSGKSVTVGALSIQDDAKLVLNGDLIVNDAANIEKDKTLTVTGDHRVTYMKGLVGDGNYIQTGGNLTASGDVVVGGNMTLTGVTANCGTYALGSNGGSAPTSAGADGTASTVTLSGGSITAATIGACGAQNTTFTFVKLENSPTLAGNLVQDHYRIAYKVGNADLDTQTLPTVLRTQTPYSGGVAGTVTVHDSKPANPTTGNDVEKLQCWYVLNTDGARWGILSEGDTLPVGLKDKTLLSSNTTSFKMGETAADGTQTLNVYACLKVEGTATIKSGRLFQSFDGGSDTVGISSRGVWTVMLVSNGTYITGRDYKVTFPNVMPVGTDFTLTVITSTGKTYYYYYTLSETRTDINFSEFTQMGTAQGVPPQLTDSEGGTETFLLSVDFGELTGNAPEGGEVKFSLKDGAAEERLTNATVRYTVTAVTNGVIAADASKVTVQTMPSGEEKRVGKKVYLVATIEKDGQPTKAPYNASASLSTADEQIVGKWLSGDTVAFNLGSYGSSAANAEYSFSFTALPAGSYSIAWRLCTCNENDPNLMNAVCSNEVAIEMSVAAQTQPKLKVICDAESRVLNGDSPHTVSFAYETTASTFTVTVEKQTTLASFTAQSTVSVSVTAESGTVDVGIPAASGTYRVRFSIADGSSNDDVYYIVIVE